MEINCKISEEEISQGKMAVSKERMKNTKNRGENWRLKTKVKIAKERKTIGKSMQIGME